MDQSASSALNMTSLIEISLRHKMQTTFKIHSLGVYDVMIFCKSFSAVVMVIVMEAAPPKTYLFKLCT